MNRKRVLVCALAIALVAGGTASRLAAGTPRKAFPTSAQSAEKRSVNPTLTRRLRNATWRWQALMGVRRSLSWAPLHTRVAYRFWVRHARHARRLAANPPHKRGWLCIHRFEGSWRDAGDPYWGGLQMDRGFMYAYAPRALLHRGFANSWTPLEQMWVAERGHRSGRGFWPWPNTARACGLL